MRPAASYLSCFQCRCVYSRRWKQREQLPARNPQERRRQRQRRLLRHLQQQKWLKQSWQPRSGLQKLLSYCGVRVRSRRPRGPTRGSRALQTPRCHMRGNIWRMLRARAAQAGALGQRYFFGDIGFDRKIRDKLGERVNEENGGPDTVRRARRTKGPAILCGRTTTPVGEGISSGSRAAEKYSQGPRTCFCFLLVVNGGP